MYNLQGDEANAKPQLETIECLSSLHAGGQSKTHDTRGHRPRGDPPKPWGPRPKRAGVHGPHRGHQPQLFLVAPLGLQQLPGSAGAFPLPTGTLLLHRAPCAGSWPLHAWLRGQCFRPQPASDSNSNRSWGRAGERTAPSGAGRLRTGQSMRGGHRPASSLCGYGFALPPGRRCRRGKPARAASSGAGRWPSSDFC